MFEKSVTTTTANPFGAQAEIEKHREEAAKTIKNPELVGTKSTSEPSEDDPSRHTYTITTTWRQGPDPEAQG